MTAVFFGVISICGLASTSSSHSETTFAENRQAFQSPDSSGAVSLAGGSLKDLLHGPVTAENTENVSSKREVKEFRDAQRIDFDGDPTPEPNGRTPFDFDGDGKADQSIYRPDTGDWMVYGSTAGFMSTRWGNSTDRLAAADYDGDGKTDHAIYRGGEWWIYNSDGTGYAVVNWGNATDIPVPADFDGDGKADYAVFREGTWWIYQTTGGPISLAWGHAGDKPVPADYDGDGKADVAVYQDGTWWIYQSTLGATGIAWGNATDVPVQADYDGDGKTDVAIVRNGTWWIYQSTLGPAAINWGNGTDIPVPADYDGDGKADVAVYREGTWWIYQSTLGVTDVHWGLTSDVPVPRHDNPTPTPTPTPTATPTPNPTPTPPATPTPTPNPTPTPPATPTPTPNPTPTPAPGGCTGPNCITVNNSQTYQTMTGWETTDFSADEYSAGWNNYKNTLFDQAVNDLGLNRIRLEIKSGEENPVDYYAQWRAGQITENQYNANRYQIANDNNDPNSINPSGFKWTQLDSRIDNIVLPLRQRLQARGEQLHVNVCYVDFGSSTFEHKNTPAEYGEFVLATYQHMQARYGFVPDTWEVILEPDTTTAAWSALQVAQAIKAAGDRLVAAGYTPRFVSPSTTNGANTPIFFETIRLTPGALAYVDVIAYHRYCCVDQAKALQIAALGTLYNKKTAMLEWMGADHNTLHEDLKYGNNSSWQQFTLATLSSWGPDNGSAYYMINDTNPLSPTVTIGSRTKLLRQYFKYVRSGAVRVGASSGNASFDPVAFRNADGKFVVVVKATTGGNFAVQGLPAGTYGIFYTTGIAYNQSAAPQTITNGQAVSTSIPAAGVITIYGQTGGGPTPSPTPTATPTPTPTPTATPAPTPTPNPTPTPSPNPTPTPPPPTGALYAAPNGSPIGNGSISSPWDLATAINQPTSVTQGKTIYMRGGTYYGKYLSNLVGATLRSYPGEWAKIDGYYTTIISAPLPAAAPLTISTMSVNGTVRMSAGATVYVENEMIQINVANPDGTYRVVRGWGGTIPSAHNTGAGVRLDGTTLEMHGSNTIYRDFELTNSNPNRSFVTTGPGGLLRDGDGIRVVGDYLKLINLIVHDQLDGLFLTEGADYTEVYGAIIYNNGHVASDRPHGHGLYIQNNTGRKTMTDIISFNNFGLGMKAYGANLGRANGVYFDGVTSFNNGSPGYYPGNPTPFPTASNRRYGNMEIGSDDHPSNDISVTNSYLYHKPGTVVEIPGLWLGRNPAGGNTNAVIRNNVIAEPSDPITFNMWTNVQVTNNMFYLYENSFGKIALVRGINSGYVWDNNTYFSPSALLTCPVGTKRAPLWAFNLLGTCGSGGSLDFNEWKQGTGFDAISTFSATRPTGKQIFVRPNQYESGRANVTIYNWDLNNTVVVNLSSAGLVAGQRFEVRNVQNYFAAPVLANQTYSAGMTITLPMTGLSVATPIGHSYTPASTCPEFCVFEVVPLP
ncbi:MAG: FG-GAP-like repeat-containing protein [Pyrinomonadaceae bacterium]